MISHHDTHNQIWKKRYGFYLSRNFKIHFHWDRDEIIIIIINRRSYYVMIVGVI